MKTRKILSFVLCLAMLLAFIPAIAPTASAATTKTIYLNAGGSSLWDQAGAWFQAWVWGSSQADAWYTFIDYNIDGVYEIEVPSDATGMKIVRRGPSHTADSWDDNQKWNNTGDLTIDSNNCYTITGWGEADGTWSTYVPPVYTVAGSAGLCGTEWTPTDVNNDMTLVDGVYTKTYHDVPAGDYKFKVVLNHAWAVAYPSSDYALTVAATSDVTIRFNAGTKAVTATVTRKYGVTFDGSNISSNGATSVADGSTYTATLTAAEGYVLPKTVSVTVGGSPVTPTWDASTGSLSIANVTGDVVITAVGIPELKFYGASLTVEEGISINFKVNAALADYYDLASASATITYEDHTEDSFTVEPVLKDGFYVFQLYNIRPDWMGDTVTATVTATLDGESVTSDPVEYSVATYCYNKLEDSASAAELKTLAADILNYGAAAQQYTGHNTSALANADLSKYNVAGTAARELKNHTAVGTEVAEPSATWKSASLNLREIVRMRVRFTTTEDITGWTVKVTGAVTATLTPTSSGNNTYTVFLDSLKVSQMSDTVIFQICDANGDPVSNSLTYSIESYAALASGDVLVNVMDYMMRYGDSIVSYLGQ